METGDCPSDEALAAWAKGTAPEDKVAALRAHTAICASCRTVVAELTRTTGERPARQQLGRYVIEEQLGAGGMGTVFAAWDPTVQRKVALKLLHEARAGDDGARAQRFLLERQVLGALEHPHIARLLDAGETEEGRPWFAMDFIDGQPIDVSCDARKLSPRDRLELMLPVLGAVGYAHQHLVVHRDLKPGNILVDAQGQPRLMDFGIARLLEGAGASLTRTGVTPMTPAYASPEQVRREPVAVTSDIYSLGVMLYELFTGVSPYSTPPGDVEALLRAIATESPLPPSSAVARAPDAAIACRASSREELRAALSGDLDAIVLMALRKEPRDRYQSIDAFASDVRAALDGLPTLARRGAAAYRAASFVRRRRGLVAGVVAAFVALSIGLVATLWQAHRAEQERDLARTRFNQVRSLARSVLFDYHDGIAALPGSTSLRERLVKDASQYLDALSAEAKDDVGLRQELATAYLKLGDVQGDPFAASLGDTRAATASYLRARTLAESVLVDRPNDWDARHVIAASHEKVGAIVEVAGALDDALAEYVIALQLDEALLAERPNDPDQLQAASLDDLAAAQVLLAQGKLDDAAPRLERCLERRAKAASLSSDFRARRGVGVVSVTLAELRQEQGRLPEAITSAQTALAAFDKLLQEYPDSFDARRQKGNTLDKLAGLYRLSGQSEKALEVSTQSVASARTQVKADPENAVAKRDLLVALGNYGASLNVNRKYEEVRVVHEEAIALALELRQVAPENMQTTRDLVYFLAQGAESATKRKEFALAEKWYREVIALAEAPQANGATTIPLEEDVAVSLIGIANIRAGEKKFDEAIEGVNKALAIFDALLAKQPGMKRIIAQHALTLVDLGEFNIGKKQFKEAREALERALAEFAQLDAEGAIPATVLDQRKEAQRFLAICDEALGKK
ncbi:MAG: protein kinase [Archangium sp.]|nr:protein kinase [Archangium sp.]